MLITDKKNTAYRIRMRNTKSQEIDVVIQYKEASAVIRDQQQRQREVPSKKRHHQPKISLYALPIYQWEPYKHNLHAGFSNYQAVKLNLML